MKKLTKIIALVLALVCICTAFAACGGNKDNKDKEKTPAVKVINYDLTSEQYAFGVDKNQPELLTQVNDIIKEMKSDGTFDAICDKYFSNGTPEPSSPQLSMRARISSLLRPTPLSSPLST